MDAALASVWFEFFDWRDEGDDVFALAIELVQRGAAGARSGTRTLSLGGSLISDAGLSSIPASLCAGLQSLSLPNGHIPIEVVGQLLQQCPCLESLGLNAASSQTRLRISGRIRVWDCEHLRWPFPDLSRLRSLGLNSRRFASGTLARILRECTGLQKVSLDSVRIAGTHSGFEIEAFQALRHCRDLEELTLSNTVVCDDALAEIGVACRKLTYVDLDGTTCFGSGIICLTHSYRSLSFLDLSRDGFQLGHSRIPDSVVQAIASVCCALTYLDIKGSEVTNATVSRLAGCAKNLRELNLTSCDRLTKAVLPAFESMASLRTLFLGDTFIGLSEELRHFCRTTKCTYLVVEPNASLLQACIPAGMVLEGGCNVNHDPFGGDDE